MNTNRGITMADHERKNEFPVVNNEDRQKDGYSEEYAVRCAKVKALREKGIDPWPANISINSTTSVILEESSQYEGIKRYEIAGRLLSIREHGKSVFAHVQDRTGTIQLYFKEDALGIEQFNFFRTFIDIGDIIWVAGISFRTKKGELTIDVQKFYLLSKCLHPLPEKFHGLVNVELKQRQRYLDLITSKESRERFIMRSRVVQAIRDELLKYEFLEVETPMLHPIPGGAAAKPFVTHHNTLHMDLFLRIAPELFLKRLVVGGFERVFEINRCFRNEGVSTKHNPEFTSVEYYIAYHDYIFMMDLTESIIKAAITKTHNSMTVPYLSYMLDFEKPFVRISMTEAVAKAVGKTVEHIENNSLQELCIQHNVYLSQEQQTWGFRLYGLFEKLVEPHLVQPTFVTHFPVEMSPLAKRNVSNYLLVDRFELFIAHMELSNGFTELNDPADQAERFMQQAHQRAGGDQEAHYYDADFVYALEHAMPPTVGAGIGIDRLVMLLTNTSSIRD
ncbi:MAG TPA: lysine--tRNA ligase, partial [Patescibacteria group bacterium]|nr:lysine--tRNA ligase [Patescibacteria group bacterium]